MLKTWRNNFEWGGGGGSLFYLTDLWLAAIWSKTGCFFRESVSTFLLLVGALATTTATATRVSKKQQVYHAKQQLCTCITLVCTPLYRPCTTTTWKCLIVSFMEDINKRRRISFSLSKLECGPQEINSREIRLHLPFSANWNKRDKDWKNGNSF